MLSMADYAAGELWVSQLTVFVCAERWFLFHCAVMTHGSAGKHRVFHDDTQARPDYVVVRICCMEQPPLFCNNVPARAVCMRLTTIIGSVLGFTAFANHPSSKTAPGIGQWTGVWSGFYLVLVCGSERRGLAQPSPRRCRRFEPRVDGLHHQVLYTRCIIFAQ